MAVPLTLTAELKIALLSVTCIVVFVIVPFDVKVGDPVIQGQNMGLSGATGRITGPHLHFGFMIQGIQSDPIEFMSQIETLFAQPPRIAQNNARDAQ